MLTVAQLISQLQQMPADARVALPNLHRGFDLANRVLAVPVMYKAEGELEHINGAYKSELEWMFEETPFVPTETLIVIDDQRG
jgi:hypothetical protein